MTNALKNNLPVRSIGAYSYDNLNIMAKINYKSLFVSANSGTGLISGAHCIAYNPYIFCLDLLA